MSKPLKELPGFAAAFAELLAREAGEGWWRDYGFSLIELGDITVPRLASIPNAQTLERFAFAIFGAEQGVDRPATLPIGRSGRRRHMDLVKFSARAAFSARAIAANDCETSE